MQERVDVYSRLILLSLFVFTIQTFQTSDLRVEGSNPSARARKINNLQFFNPQINLKCATFVPLSFKNDTNFIFSSALQCKEKLALFSMCIGVGQGISILLERV